MPYTGETTIWGLVGLLAGAAVTLLLGWWKYRNEDQHGLTRAQREMLEATWKRSKTQDERIDALQDQLLAQQQFYESQVAEMRQGYQEELTRREAECNERIEALRKELEWVKERYCAGG